MNKSEVEINCPHCQGPILVVIEREDVSTVRRLVPQTEQDTEELRSQRGW
jgi:hypothetical protein